MGTYLTRRKNSQNWLLDLTFPTGFEFDPLTRDFFGGRRHFTKSMGTADRDEAELHAAPYVHRFKLALWVWKSRQCNAGREALESTWTRKWDDGHHKVGPFDLFVKGDQVTYLEDGEVLKVDANPKILGFKADVPSQELADAMLAINANSVVPPRFAPKPKGTKDDDIIDLYCEGKRQAVQDDCRHIWATYKEVVNKPLAKATPLDVRELAKALDARGSGQATIQKKLGWIAAAINHAIGMQLFTGVNPFVAVARKGLGQARKKKLVFTEDHMGLCWESLHKISENDALLWKLLAQTGMRLGEACSIRAEETERASGIRFCWLGTKNEASWRRIPLPLDIGLPAKIEGELFPGGASAASKRLNRFIDKAIPNAPKLLTVHSLRHRAIDIWRESNTDSHLRRRLVGHAAKDEHDRYGGEQPRLRLLVPLIEMNVIDGTFSIPDDEEVFFSNSPTKYEKTQKTIDSQELLETSKK